MPYGIPNETPAITKKMERCISGISGENPQTGKPYTESEKVAICKSQIMKNLSEDVSGIVRCSGELRIGENRDKWQEIVRVGDWKNSYKEFEITEKDLNDFVDNFQKNVLRLRDHELQVNFSHNSHEKAAGWIYELMVENGVLLAKIRWTKAGGEAIQNEEFKYFSAEIIFMYRDEETGEKVKNVLLGAALTNIPFVRDMAAVALSESADNAKDHSIYFFQNLSTKNMETFKALCESLAGKASVSPSEFDMLKVAFTSLSEEEQEEAKTAVDEVETKVETPKPETEEEETKTPEGEEETSEEEGKEELSDSRMAEEAKMFEKKLSEAQKELSQKQAELDKAKAQIRRSDLDARVTALSSEGKIVGEDAVSKTVDLLMDLSEEKASKWLDFLSGQPARVDLNEYGVSSVSHEAKEVEMVIAKAKKLSQDSGRPYSECYDEFAREAHSAR